MQRTTKSVLCILSLVIAIGLWLKATVIHVPSGTWAPAGNMAEARFGAASALLQDGTILVTGGEGASGALASGEFFSAGSFASAPAMNVARSRQAAVVLQDGRVLVTGGKTTGGGVTNAAEIYSQALNSWIVIASMADARSGHTATLLNDGRVLLAGGEGSAGAVSTLEVFDPIAGTFTFAGTMSSARKNHAAALSGDGKVLIAGGSNGSNALASTEIYDPETGAVTAGPALSTPRAGLSATTLMDGHVLIAGGNNGTADLATAEVFNSTTGVVSLIASSLASARRDHLAFLLPHNNHVLIVGGTSGGTVLATAELFRPWDGNFHPTGAMSAPRAGFSGGPLALDGLFLVAGGIGAANSELYGFATIKTDKDDYLPGELVLMTGSGWQPGETVTLFLHEINNPEPHDDLTLTAVADAAGRIVNNQFAPDEHDNGVRFYLTATSASSQAQTTFTDGTPQVDSVSNSPFSPNQMSSAGVKDSTDILAKNQGGGGSVSDFRIRIRAGSTIGTLVREFLCGSVNGNDTCTQTWDGKNSAASFVADGTYFALASSGTTETTTPTSRIGTIVVDNTNPTVSLLAPANGATVTANFKLEAIPLDAGGNDSNIDKVEFYVDGLLIDTDASSGGGWTTGGLNPSSFSNGIHTWFAKAFDRAGNNAISSSRTFNVGAIDTTPPVITPTISGTLGNNGWYISNVTVSWTVTDPESSVSSTTGCGTTNVSADTAGTTFTCQATSVGGNSSQSVTVKRDATAPTLAFGAASPAANANGWNNTNVSFPFTTADNLSGVASSTPVSPLQLITEGSSLTGSVTVTDMAGNSATFTSASVNIDKTKPTSSAAASPAANVAGWNNTDVTVTFTGSDSLSGIDSCTSAAILSTEGAGQSASGTCTDKAGNLSDPAVKNGINIDKTKPTASAAASPAANAAGWNNTDVTVSFSGLDGLSGIDSCTSPSTLGAEAAGQSASGTCTDNAGNVSDPAVKSGINIDKTKPTLAFGTATPAANGNGWNNSDVSFSFTPADALSGVASTSPAASPLVLVAEGSGVTGTVTVTDVAGNSETFTSPAVKIDKTAPTISGSRSPVANAFGWNNTNVTVSFSCTDGLSGLAAGSPPADTAVASEGANQSVDGTCHDQAGNTASTQVSGISIDKTKPTASAAASPAANAAGWNNTNVTVTFTGADALSGIDTCVAPTVLTAEGVGQSASGNCTDKAGNQSDAAIVNGIKIDKTKPMLTFGAASPAANANGWNNTNVSFSFTTLDTLSGVASSSPASLLTLWAEGSAVTGSVLVTDVAGNSQTFVSPAVKIDKTAPAITGSRFPLANAYGWNNTNVTVSFGCTDTLSGVFTAPVSPVPLSTEGESQMVPGSCADYAGNSSAAMVGPINIDKTAPALPANVLANPAAIATQGTLTAVVSDPLSKIIKAEFTVNGVSILLMNPATGFSFPALSVNVTATIPLQPVGVYNLCVRAQDRAENYSGEECTLFAVYDPNGGFVTGGGWINSPLGAYAMNVALTGKANFGFVSKYQKGATIPVGQTEFQFKAGDLNFHSSSYEWLVIAGSKAQYKGSGKINGAGDYGFILTANDGSLNGGDGVDKFRMKIQDKSSGTVIYDSQLGAADGDAPTTTLGGGSIQIKK